MRTIQDSEFGEIVVRAAPGSRQISLRVDGDGQIRVSAPRFASMRSISRLIDDSRQQIRQLRKSSVEKLPVYHIGETVGKSHSIITSHSSKIAAGVRGQHIVLELPVGMCDTDDAVQAVLRQAVKKALRQEASHYLPRRLARLSELHNYNYERVRFTNAKTRWGSCSSSGTISLNIALMQLPFELIDYVLLHELAHTRHMNHSRDFWEAVEQTDSSYRIHRRALKSHSPTI